MRTNDGKFTCRGFIASVIHDDIKHVLYRHLVVVEVVRSRDRRCRIRSQGLGGGVGVEDDGLGRYVVLANRDVVSFSSLQEESHDFVNVGVYGLTPRRRGV